MKIKLPNWLAKKNNISRELEGVIKVETDKAILFKGNAFAEKRTHCMRCGRELTHPVSQVVGFGPVCSRKLGIDWDAHEEDIDALTKEIEKITFEGWLPKSQVIYLTDKETIDNPTENPSTMNIRGSVYVDKAEYIIEFDYNKELVEKVKEEIPGRKWNPDKKYWHAPICPRAAQAIHNIDFESYGLEVSENVKKIFKDYREAHDNSSQLKEVDLEIEGIREGVEFRDFQKAGINYALDKERTFIADQQGLGKTIEAIGVIQKEKAYPALIVVPAAVKINWQREFEKWIKGITTTIINGQKNESLPDADVYIINYDILAHNESILKTKEFKSIVLDESHYVKNPKAKRTKTATRIVKELEIPIRLLLTGTPLSNRPKELISQLKILEKLDELGGFWNFANRYCDAKRNAFGLDLSGAKNLEELNSNLRAVGFVRREKREVLQELPEKQRTELYVEIDNWKEYKSAEQDINNWVRTQTQEEGRSYNVVMAEALVKMNILKRLVGEGKINSAINWIEDFLETGEKLVVFAHHRKVLKSLAEHFNAPLIIGGQSDKERQKIIDAFQNNPNVKIVIASIKAAGVGITLTAASDVLFVEQMWTSTAHEQAEDRLHRIGQKDSVNCYYMIDEDTIDNYLRGVIENKEEIFKKITETI